MVVKIKTKAATGNTDTVAKAPVMWPMSVHVVKALEKSDTGGAPHSQALNLEDEFTNQYFSIEGNKGLVIAPPYNPRVLMRICSENNTLLQAIDAMEVNIDGTGFEIESLDDEDTDEDTVIQQEVKSFFSEPWPRMSFVTMRRAMRRDLECTGNAYLEVIRNPDGEIMFLRNIDSVSMRLVRLSELSERIETVMRRGVEVELAIATRDRGFAQFVGSQLVYFKEYGASRDIHRQTGKWVPKAELPFEDRGNEVIHFTVTKDAYTDYGVPRWINQLPSAIGSREAEELNLKFFDTGGIPPILILLSGGKIVEEGRKSLESIMSGSAKDKLQAAIVEAQPTSGSLDASATMKMQVERFGSEKQNDSMFENYDKRCAERVRGSFRLPPIFLGKAEDYSFATASASYAVAEAQVFQPERREFDEIMRVTLIRELSGGQLKMRSFPLSIKDANTQLRGIELAGDHKHAEQESVLEQINEVTGLEIRIRDEASVEADAEAEREREAAAAERIVPQENVNAPPAPPKGPAPSDAAKSAIPIIKDTEAMKALVQLADAQHNIIVGVDKLTDADVIRVQEMIMALGEDHTVVFHDLLAKKVYGDISADPEGARELVASASKWADRIMQIGPRKKVAIVAE